MYKRQVFHHKTRKPKFKTGVPAILIIQLIIYFLFSGNEGIIPVSYTHLDVYKRQGREGSGP